LGVSFSFTKRRSLGEENSNERRKGKKERIDEFHCFSQQKNLVAHLRRTNHLTIGEKSVVLVYGSTKEDYFRRDVDFIRG